MAFAAAAARRSLASRGLPGHLARRLHPALPHLLPYDYTGDPRKPSPPPAPRLFHFPLASPGAAQTLNLLPFGPHLAGPPGRRFSSSSSRDLDLADNVLTDAADSVAPAAAAAVPASFPGEVAWAAEDSSLAFAAVQHLIDAVHSFTGLNWWISIALSTAMLRCVLLLLWTRFRTHLYAIRQEIQQTSKLVLNAKDDTSREEAGRAALSCVKMMGLPVFIPLVVTPYTFVTLYIAISNMVENVPSLKGGGAFWFTDLTAPDALRIFPMITSLFLMLTLELKHRAFRNLSTGSSHETDRVKVLLVFYLLSMPLTATLPQAVCCSFATWSFGSFAERIALNQPAVQKLLYGAPLKPTSSSSDGQKGPTAEDSPSPVKEHEPVPPEKRKPSDASVHRVRDQSDKKSIKGG